MPVLMRTMPVLTDEQKKILHDRMRWLEDKLREMRRVGGPDYTPSVRLQGRIEGELGGIEWVLDNLGRQKINPTKEWWK